LLNIEIEFTNEIKSLNTIIKNLEAITEKFGMLLSSTTWIDESKFKSSIELFGTVKNEINMKIKASKNSTMLDSEQIILKTINIVETVKIKNQELENLNNELSKYKNFFDMAKLIYSTYSMIKKDKIQQIHNGIQEEIERFYGFIHKDEEHGDIKLIIDPNKRGSTDIQVASFDSYVDPRAFQSEGHLDSLGLCIFLAFVKKFNKSSNLMILDDIVTTIDSQHRMRICELLYKNFNDKQIIMTTHDNVWFEQLISCQNIYDLRNNFLNLKIDEWTIDNGPKLSKYLSREERINKKLESNDKNSAGNEIRQYFEFVLKNLCENMHAEVPFKNDGKYMADELLNASKKRLNKLIKDVTWKKEVAEIFKEIEGVRFLSNILSHDNLEILQISINEIRFLYTSIKNLEKKFQCNSCLRNLEYDRNGSLIRCVNKTCKKRLVLETT
jgi:energy-coupling factor transporter ATP-binding protein EcfA2